MSYLMRDGFLAGTDNGGLVRIGPKFLVVARHRGIDSLTMMAPAPEMLHQQLARDEPNSVALAVAECFFEACRTEWVPVESDRLIGFLKYKEVPGCEGALQRLVACGKLWPGTNPAWLNASPSFVRRI